MNEHVMPARRPVVCPSGIDTPPGSQIIGLFRDGTDRKPLRPTGGVMHIYLPLFEDQGVTATPRVALASRPVEAFATHVLQPISVGFAKTRSGEIYCGIRTADLVVEVPAVVPDIIDIEFKSRIGGLTRGCEAGEGICGGHLETGRAGVVDGLDNDVVIVSCYRIVSRPQVVISGVAPVIIVNITSPGIYEHILRMLDGIIYGTTALGVVKGIATLCNGICARQGILAAPLVVRRGKLLEAAVVLCDGEHAGLLAPSLSVRLLNLHLDAAGRGIGGAVPNSVLEAERFVGELVDLVLEVRAGGGVEHVLWGEPQMPGSYHGAALGDGDDGIAVLDGRGGDLELHEGIGAAARHGEASHETTLICPHQLGTIRSVGTAARLRDPRVGDVLSGVVLEMLEDISTAVRGLVRTWIVAAVLDGVAIDQWDAVVAGRGDDVTVGGAARYASALGGEVVGSTSRAQGRGGFQCVVARGEQVDDVGRECGSAGLGSRATVALGLGERGEPGGLLAHVKITVTVGIISHDFPWHRLLRPGGRVFAVALHGVVAGCGDRVVHGGGTGDGKLIFPC